MRCSVHFCPQKDNIDYAENPREPGVTRALLRVSQATPARSCLFSS